MTECYIYRCSAKQDMYIYLAKENNFDVIDEHLKSKLGHLRFTMNLQLKQSTKLAKEDPLKVIANLQSQGFHLQLPAEISVEKLLSSMATIQ
ncbi:MAG TPA: YcgL domain-containing protein [Gammaproteobacteria bacterium]|nr:YcgL domain-containing protein [Gammaproteobacteria bacterium]